ncbi:Psa2p [Trichosporon asahii var. asahii CBS 8904]|uniref:mannose-1-phosphate guanylyltransferase n=1 Tax=Trichosporon asahii var. asahii (strain CBS 8904) TaxID=1220162 RepID=K1VGY4_TRIAC|nr:Psa2p [Trichosporon asahii var. asahii CBS 8904]
MAPVTKGVILVGGPSKGTRMRPLTLDCECPSVRHHHPLRITPSTPTHINVNIIDPEPDLLFNVRRADITGPKPLLPIAGKPMVWHPLAALAQVPGLTDVFLIGFYEDSVMAPFVKEAQREFPKIKISYLREYKALGTAGGLYHFRDAILRAPVPDHIFICNIDICSTFPFEKLLDVHTKHRGVGTIMGVPVKKENASKYGCIVYDPDTSVVLHYVEKPESYISNTVNGGVYPPRVHICATPSPAPAALRPWSQLTSVFDKAVFDSIKVAMDEKTARASLNPLAPSDEKLQLEENVIAPLSAARKMTVFVCTEPWRQIKTAASALAASALYLDSYKAQHPELLYHQQQQKDQSSCPTIVEPVYIDPSASIDASAKIGPNVAIGPGVQVGDGVRICNAMVMEGSELASHAVVSQAIVGERCSLGLWARVDGEPEREDEEGKRDISVSVLASEVALMPEVHVRSCIVLPNKTLGKSAAKLVLL